MGSVGPHVRAIQAYLGLSVRGVFDVKTEEAVRKFQENAGLTDDGIVGRRTWAALVNSGLDARYLPSFGPDEALDVSDGVRLAHAAAYNADGVLEQDQLNILGDVRALATVMASNRTSPPLSVGLFGDWGSGKSFFMHQLQLHIHELATQSWCAEHSEPPEPSFFCSEVVQIDFNAWHYVDANLWASLVTRIFEGLSEHVERQRGASEAYQALFSQLETARVLLSQAEARQRAAESVLAQAKEAKAELPIDQEAEADTRTVQDFVEQNPQLGDAAEQLATTLGIDRANLSLAELRRLANDLGHVVGRLRQGWNALDRTRGFWSKRRLSAVLAATAVLAAFGLRWLVATNADIAGFSALIGSVITAATSVIVSLGRTTNQALGAAAQVIAKDDEDRKKRLVDAQQQVEEAQQDAKSARKQLEQIQQLDAETVYRFIEDRYMSSDYRQHLGIVALIQRDFRRLSERLASSNGIKQSAGHDGDPPLPRIDRIVLYIDDLDRCPSDRVVKVLQAVHLLLAFPLFVVVVGVDSRWLLRSLRHEYSALLTSSAEDRSFSGEDSEYWASTPQNYLEKIFQIPYWIRSMEKEGYIRLVRSLIESGTKDESAQDKAGADDSPFQDTKALSGRSMPASSSSTTDNTGRGDGSLGEWQSSAASSATVKEELEDHPELPQVSDDVSRAAEDDRSPRRDPTIDLIPAKLLITPHEQAFIESLGPLIPTPRVAKRFINTYWLLRVSTTDPDTFKEQSGRYQAVLLLLAIMNGFPSQAGTLFYEIMKASNTTWLDFIKDIRPLPLDEVTSRTKGEPVSHQQESDGFTREFASRLLGSLNAAEAAPWLRLCQKLDEIHPHLTVSSLTAFQIWVGPVARYSFEAGRMIESTRL
jgi:hypothetical protein